VAAGEWFTPEVYWAPRPPIIPEVYPRPFSPPPAPFSPPHSPCADTPNWVSPAGNVCGTYADNGWCVGGAAGAGFESMLGARWGFPEMHCCVCGKPTSAPQAASSVVQAASSVVQAASSVGQAPGSVQPPGWYPICGHHLWNDATSAASGALACRSLAGGHNCTVNTTGQVRRDYGGEYNADSVQVGACKATDKSLAHCTAGGNRFYDFPLPAHCGAAGSPLPVQFKCSNECTVPQASVGQAFNSVVQTPGSVAQANVAQVSGGMQAPGSVAPAPASVQAASVHAATVPSNLLLPTSDLPFLSPPPPPNNPRHFRTFDFANDCKRGVAVGGIGEIVGNVHVDTSNLYGALDECWTKIYHLYPSVRHPFQFADGMELGVVGRVTGQCWAFFKTVASEFKYRAYYPQEADWVTCKPGGMAKSPYQIGRWDSELVPPPPPPPPSPPPPTPPPPPTTSQGESFRAGYEYFIKGFELASSQAPYLDDRNNVLELGGGECEDGEHRLGVDGPMKLSFLITIDMDLKATVEKEADCYTKCFGIARPFVYEAPRGGCQTVTNSDGSSYENCPPPPPPMPPVGSPSPPPADSRYGSGVAMEFAPNSPPANQCTCYTRCPRFRHVYESLVEADPKYRQKLFIKCGRRDDCSLDRYTPWPTPYNPPPPPPNPSTPPSPPTPPAPPLGPSPMGIRRDHCAQFIGKTVNMWKFTNHNGNGRRPIYDTYDKKDACECYVMTPANAMWGNCPGAPVTTANCPPAPWTVHGSPCSEYEPPRLYG